MKGHLGERLKVGDIFQTTTKRVTRREMRENRWYKPNSGLRAIRRIGEQDYFVKGKRRYLCEVKGISQTTTGLHCWQDIARPGMLPGSRWWQFTYVVKILEN